MDRIADRTARIASAPRAPSRERERRTDAPHTTQEVPASGPGLDLPHPAVWSRKLHDMYEHGFSAREMTNILSNPPVVASHVSSVFRLSRCVVFVRVALILGGIPMGIWH